LTSETELIKIFSYSIIHNSKDIRILIYVVKKSISN